MSQQIPPDWQIAAQWSARARYISHVIDFWGDPTQEFRPSRGFEMPFRPEFLLLEFAPRADRAWFTYASAGLSLYPQLPDGPMPFIELVAYAPGRDVRIAEFLLMLAHDIATGQPGEPAFKAFDLWGAERYGMRDFVLVPAREPAELLDFPSLAKRKEDERYLLATTASLDGKMTLDLLQLVPLTSEEWAEATRAGSRSLLERIGWASQPPTYGWSLLG
jgi:hypothetical protein